MTRRHDLPDELSGAPFAVRDALTRGVGEHRLWARDLARPYHGVRVPAGRPLDLEMRCQGLATRFREDDAFCGPTAAALWGMPLPARLAAASILFVSSTDPRQPMRRRGVAGSLRMSADIVEHRGVPVLAPMDAWLSLAGAVRWNDLTAAADFLVTGVQGDGALCSLEELRDHLEHRRGRHGVSDARRALSHARVGAWSRPETLLRIVLCQAGLPAPALNRSMLTPRGRTLTPDLSYPEFRVAVEYNGGAHDDAHRYSIDLRRMDDYAELDWDPVNVERDEFFARPMSVVERTAARLARRGWSGRPIDAGLLPSKSGGLER